MVGMLLLLALRSLGRDSMAGALPLLALRCNDGGGADRVPFPSLA